MNYKPIINILGVNISNFRKPDIHSIIDGFLSVDCFKLIATINPEFILVALEDEEFFCILNQADLSVADGSGLWFAGLVMGKHIYRYPGVELADRLMMKATQKKIRVAIFNWRGGLMVAAELEKVLGSRYKGIKLRVFDIDRDGNTMNWSALEEWQPQIIFCTLGAPWQEKFLFRNRLRFSGARIGIGIGGAFDLLTGKVKRAPRVMRILCLEWLWRAFIHRGKNKGDRKKRLTRIYRSAVVFPWKFIQWRFIQPWLYRPNVVCLIYREINGMIEILTVKRTGEPNHWQIPQGGTDGEPLANAAKREIREELGITNIALSSVFPNIYKYKFGNRDGHDPARAEECRKHTGYQGQKQGLVIARYTGDDSDIMVHDWDHSDRQWVEQDKLVDHVHPIRKEATRIYLEKFREYITQKD